MRRSVAVLVGSTAAVLVGSLTGCGQDAAGGGAPAPVTSSAPAEQADETGAVPAYPTLPAVVVRGEAEMPPPTDDQRRWFAELTSGDLGGVPETTMEDVQRQQSLGPAFDALAAMPGWAWGNAGTGSGDGQEWDGSVGFAGAAPQEALDVLRGLPIDVRVVQGVLFTEEQRAAAQDAACDVVFKKPGGITTGSCGTDQDTLLITIDYSGPAAPDPAALQARALAAARATTPDPVAKDVLDVMVTHRDEPVVETATGTG